MFIEPVTISGSVDKRAARKINAKTNVVSKRALVAIDGSDDAETTLASEDSDDMDEEIIEMEDLDPVALADTKVFHAEARVLGDILDINV